MNQMRIFTNEFQLDCKIGNVFQTGEPLNGYYMVAEATNQHTAQKSRLYSPIYDALDSVNACFRFYYHMYGAIVGTLRVYVKPLSMKLHDMDDIQKK